MLASVQRLSRSLFAISVVKRGLWEHGSLRWCVLQRLGAHIADALERAAAAERRVIDATDPDLTLDNERMAQSWRLPTPQAKAPDKEDEAV
jgi:hypothetical protein